MEQDELRCAIRELGGQEYGAVFLGTPSPMRTQTVNTVISHGKRAVPYLITSLESSNLVEVGYSSYCLELLHADEGGEVASRRLAEVSTGDLSLMEVRFARAALDSYVKSVTSKK